MSALLQLFVSLLANLPAAQAIPWAGPAPTVDANIPGIPRTWNPKQTPGPKSPPEIELIRRDFTVPPNTCGWVNGDPNVAWTVVGGFATCFFNSDLKIVNGWTTCLNYGQSMTASCDSVCSQLINNCPFSTPYCGTVLFPDDYVAFGDCQSGPNRTFNIQLTYHGQTEPVDLPIYTGVKGISTGLQYPLGYSASTTSTSAVSSSSTSSATSSPTATSTPTSTPTPVGAIVGGVIGGIALLCITATVVIWILRHRGRDHSTIKSPHNMDLPMHLQNDAQPDYFQHRMHEMEQPTYRSELPQSPRSPQEFPPQSPKELDAFVDTKAV